jgi:hypothetical protein
MDAWCDRDAIAGRRKTQTAAPLRGGAIMTTNDPKGTVQRLFAAFPKGDMDEFNIQVEPR